MAVYDRRIMFALRGIHNIPQQSPSVSLFCHLDLRRVWRTSHRYSEFLALKDSLRLEFGSRHLPANTMFPEKENLVSDSKLSFVGATLVAILIL